MISYPQALEKIKEGSKITAHHWQLCKVIRLWHETDAEYFQNINFDTSAVVIEDCKNKICDCDTGIFRPTQEDIDSTDYIIVE